MVAPVVAGQGRQLALVQRRARVRATRTRTAPLLCVQRRTIRRCVLQVWHRYAGTGVVSLWSFARKVKENNPWAPFFDVLPF